METLVYKVFKGFKVHKELRVPLVHKVRKAPKV